MAIVPRFRSFLVCSPAHFSAWSVGPQLKGVAGAGRLHRRPLGQARTLLLELFQSSPALTLAQFRDAAGISRRYALLLLEHWDRKGLTRREGNYRVLLDKNM